MNDASTKQLLLAYVEGWKSGDREKILNTLDPACVVIESYGPTYRGKKWSVDGSIPGLLQVTSSIAGMSLLSMSQMRHVSLNGSLNVRMRASGAALREHRLRG